MLLTAPDTCLTHDEWISLVDSGCGAEKKSRTQQPSLPYYLLLNKSRRQLQRKSAPLRRYEVSESQTRSQSRARSLSFTPSVLLPVLWLYSRPYSTNSARTLFRPKYAAAFLGASCRRNILWTMNVIVGVSITSNTFATASVLHFASPRDAISQSSGTIIAASLVTFVGLIGFSGYCVL